MVALVDKKDSGVLPCVFYNDVLCSFRKHKRVTIMPRCKECEYFVKFNSDMDKEDEEFWIWEEKVRANPDAYLRGEL